MARIQINLDLDTNISGDAELLGKLTVAFGGNQNNASPSVNFVAESILKGVAMEPRIAIIPENMETKKAEDEVEKFRGVSTYSEEELKAIPRDELKSIATNLGIDWASAEGKNTNAKLAKLILKHYDYDKSAESENDTDDPEKDIKEDPKKPAPADITLDELKVELGAKVDANRDAIVEKLNELGATKLTNLNESHFLAFRDFLKSL
jgi:hypothetical protein